MGACLDGMPGHHLLTPSQLGEALRDYVGNGGSKTPNLRHFRSYLERAAIKREPRASTNGTPADPTLATLEAMKSEPGWS